MSKKKGPNTSQWTLMKFLEEHYIPSKTEAIGLTKETAKTFRARARSFERFAGEGVKMREISRVKLEDFVAWSIERGLASVSANNYATHICVLVRAWQPARLPCEKRGGSTMAFLERDVPGSLEELFHERYLPQHTRMSSVHSIRQCGNAIRHLTQYLGHIASLDDLTDETLGGWQRHMVHVEGKKRSTANGYFSRVLAMWNWAAKKRLVELFPTVSKYRLAERIPKAWTREELDMLLVACGKAKGEIAEVDAADFWVAFHYVAWDTGERTGAMLSLTWEMLSFQTATLSVPAEIRKGGLKAMVYRLKPATIKN